MLAMLRTAPAVFSGGEDGCRQAVELVDEPPPPGADIWPLVMAIVGHLELGNTERAEALLDGLQQPRSGRLELCLAHYLAGWLELLRNNPDKAFLQQKAALVYAVEIGIPVLEAMCHLALALTLVHWHDAQQSAAHIDQARQRLQGLRAPFVEFLGTLVNAFRDYIVQRPAERDRHLQAALRIGREHGYTLLPGWTPQMLAPICIRALQAGYETGYVRSLIRAKNLRPAEPPLRVVAWPWRLRISTLGTFDIVVDDVPLVSSGKGRNKPLELLKTLIGLGGESVSAMQIATILWPNVDEEYAFKNYTINLHRLRKLLGDDGALIQREGRLSLDPASAWLDCRAVLATAKEIEQLSRAAREQKQSTRIIALAAELLAVYRGTFLADEADSTVYQQQRQRMREVLQQSILPLGRYWEEAGEWERAVDIYRQALKRERTAGPLYVQLLACYRRLDRRADALAAYEACRVNLDPQQFERLFGVLEKALGDWLQ